jgi:hypothetical protein
MTSDINTTRQSLTTRSGDDLRKVEPWIADLQQRAKAHANHFSVMKLGKGALKRIAAKAAADATAAAAADSAIRAKVVSAAAQHALSDSKARAIARATAISNAKQDKDAAEDANKANKYNAVAKEASEDAYTKTALACRYAKENISNPELFSPTDHDIVPAWPLEGALKFLEEFLEAKIKETEQTPEFIALKEKLENKQTAFKAAETEFYQNPNDATKKTLDIAAQAQKNAKKAMEALLAPEQELNTIIMTYKHELALYKLQHNASKIDDPSQNKRNLITELDLRNKLGNRSTKIKSITQEKEIAKLYLQARLGDSYATITQAYDTQMALGLDAAKEAREIPLPPPLQVLKQAELIAEINKHKASLLKQVNDLSKGKEEKDGLIGIITKYIDQEIEKAIASRTPTTRLEKLKMAVCSMLGLTDIARIKRVCAQLTRSRFDSHAVKKIMPKQPKGRGPRPRTQSNPARSAAAAANDGGQRRKTVG